MVILTAVGLAKQDKAPSNKSPIQLALNTTIRLIMK